MQIRDDLETLTYALGIAKTAKTLRIAPQRLASILSGKVRLDNVLGRALSARLPAAQAQMEILFAERRQELEQICRKVEEFGLRGAARQLGVDPSNLRRWILNRQLT